MALSRLTLLSTNLIRLNQKFVNSALMMRSPRKQLVITMKIVLGEKSCSSRTISSKLIKKVPSRRTLLNKLRIARGKVTSKRKTSRMTKRTVN